MKLTALLLLILLGLSFNVNAQTFELNSLFLTLNSYPKAYSGKIEINDSTVIFTANGLVGDTAQPVVTTERILRKKAAYVKTKTASGANNYDWELSSDKTEKNNGIYIISIMSVSNDGLNRNTLYFKGKMLP